MSENTGLVIIILGLSIAVVWYIRMLAKVNQENNRLLDLVDEKLKTIQVLKQENLQLRMTEVGKQIDKDDDVIGKVKPGTLLGEVELNFERIQRNDKKRKFETPEEFNKRLNPGAK